VETDLDRWYRVSIGLSRGEGQPQPLARLELTTVELQPGGRAIAALRPAPRASDPFGAARRDERAGSSRRGSHAGGEGDRRDPEPAADDVLRAV